MTPDQMHDLTDLKPNAELAYAVLDQIDAHPEAWDQGTWWCETGGCFAGWACSLSGAEMKRFPAGSPCPETVVTGGLTEELNGRPVAWAAARLLGIDWRAAGWDEAEDVELFEAGNSREDLGAYVTEMFGPRPIIEADPDGDA